MKKMKRLEIVIDKPHVPELVDQLKKLGVKGYTILTGVEGYGSHGEQSADELSGIFNNWYIITAVEEDIFEAVSEAIKARLEFGGICMVSDVESLMD